MNVKARDRSASPAPRKRGPTFRAKPRKHPGVLRRTLFYGALVVLILAVGVALALAAQTWSQPGGTLAAEKNFHDFGQVRMSDGVVSAQFPLTVQGTTVVTEIVTS